MDNDSDRGADDIDPCRVWLANLPPMTTEYSVLRLVRTFGEIVSFDFPVHRKKGPLQGSTLGFCFFTFRDQESASRALREYVYYYVNHLTGYS